MLCRLNLGEGRVKEQPRSYELLLPTSLQSTPQHTSNATKVFEESASAQAPHPTQALRNPSHSAVLEEIGRWWLWASSPIEGSKISDQ